MTSYNNTALRADNIHQYLDNQYIIEGISIVLPYNKTVSICGDSGSGKTTLLNILSLTTRPQKGVVFLDGKYVTTCSRKEKNLFLGYCKQSSSIIETLSIKENILLKIHMHSYTNEKLNLVDNIIQDLHLSPDRKASSLSGGERQKLCLARALCNMPKVLILDEPFNNLDKQHIAIVSNIISKLQSQTLMSVLITSHIPVSHINIDINYTIHSGKLHSY